MIETRSTIPKRMSEINAVFSKKYGWCKYTPDHGYGLITSACTECTKKFYGLDSFIVLTLHKILSHEKEVVDDG